MTACDARSATTALRSLRPPRSPARRRALATPSASSTRARMARNPVMFVVEIGSVLTTILFFSDQPTSERRLRGLHRRLALVHRALRQLRRGDGRGPRQGPGRRRCARRAPRRSRTGGAADGTIEDVAEPTLRVGDVVVVVGRRGHPRRRRRHRGHRVRRRVGDHRRVGAGHPRVGRRPLGGHRRHARALRPRSWSRITSQAGRDLPRPDDRARRGRRAAEDAERDRAQHPARRADDHLPARGRHAAAVRRSTRGAEQSVDRARRAARLPDPDDDRRAALGDRHRRHGPARAAQRARDAAAARSRRRATARRCCSTRPGTITLGNRQAVRVPPRCRASTSGSSPTRRCSRAWPTRRPRAARSSCSPRSASACAAATCARRATLVAVHRADPHERRRPRRAQRIRKGAADAVAPLGRRSRAASFPPSSSRRRARSRARGGTPLVVAETAARARRHPPQGHRQGRHPRALRRAARDGHPHGDDHRRQPAHRRGHRRRGRRRRLPRRGHARGQAGADPQRAGRRASSSP